MIVPGRWHAQSGRPIYDAHRRPLPGQILAVNFNAWRVLAVVDLASETTEHGLKRDYRVDVAQILPGGAEGDLQVISTWDYEIYPERPHSKTPGVTLPAMIRGPHWQLLPEHFSVCSRCADVQPCREQVRDAEVDRALDELERFDNPSMCPACTEPITLRQKTLALPNVISPAGGTVTFHAGRHACRYTAASYEKRVLAAGLIPKLTLSCPGRLIQHQDDSLECLDLDCPNVEAQHGHYQRCYTRTHGCSRLECQLNLPAI